MTGMEALAATGGDINKLIAWFPLDPIAKALQQLVVHRESIKQTIYEVTGLADILRGASDASETATAQQIKAQWGSLRIQSMQSEVQRFARDLFRLKAEILCNKFSWDTLSLMTGLKYPTQEERALVESQKAQYEQMAARAQQGGPPPPPIPPEVAEQAKDILDGPTLEEVQGLLSQDAVRGYRIDIESDSTIRGDVVRNQQQMSTFVQGLGQYFQAVGPAVLQGAMPLDVAVEVATAFSRSMKLGKQAEDALDRWADEARKKSQEPPAEKPDPAMAKIEADAKAKEAEIAHKKELAQADMALTKEKHGAELQMTREKTQAELQLQREKMQGELTLKRELGAMQAQQQAQQAEFGFGLEERRLQAANDFESRKLASTTEFENRKLSSSEAIERERIADGAKARREQALGEGYKVRQTESGDEEAVAAEDLRTEAVAGAMQMLAQALAGQAEATERQTQATEKLVQVQLAETELVKGPDGSKRARKVLVN
jgi:hypothetical protein